MPCPNFHSQLNFRVRPLADPTKACRPSQRTGPGPPQAPAIPAASFPPAGQAGASIVWKNQIETEVFDRTIAWCPFRRFARMALQILARMHPRSVELSIEENPKGSSRELTIDLSNLSLLFSKPLLQKTVRMAERVVSTDFVLVDEL